MKLILCHATCDFDSLGAAVGLSLVHPEAKILLPAGVQTGVDAFLAVYRDLFPFIDKRALDFSLVEELFVVDTSSSSQLGSFAKELSSFAGRLHVIDHHPEGDLVKKAFSKQIEQVGATATLVVEELIGAAIEPPVAYALALALGVHSDTGSLLFDSTTVRDIEALLFLTRMGASPQLCNQFIGSGLTPEQLLFFEEGRESLDCHSLDGLEVGLAYVQQQERRTVTGLGDIASELRRFGELDVLFLIVQLSEVRFRVVGRSKRTHPYLKESPDLGALFRRLGGGGHPGAASVTLSGLGRSEVAETLLTSLQQEDSWSVCADDVMSSPARTIADTISLDEAAHQLDQYGHSGLLVVDKQGALVGVISRRDIDKAIRHNLGHAPVKAYMATRLVTAGPQSTLRTIHELFAQHDIGRVPILENGSLRGVVTRSDLMKFYGELLETNIDDLGRHISTSLTQDEACIMQLCRDAAACLNLSLFLVGGAVRDLLLRMQGSRYDITDIDIVVHSDGGIVESDSIKAYAEELVRLSSGKLVRSAPQFGTASVSLPWNGKSFKVDIAAARTEHYSAPAVDPHVTPGSLYEDLVRRDFSVNALACGLTGRYADHMIDYFQGVKDLKDGVVRVLHPLSFVEDPTRIIRAARLVSRRNFTLDPETERFALELSHSRSVWGNEIPTKTQAGLGRRLGMELNLLFASSEWFAALAQLWKLNTFLLFDDSFLNPQEVFLSFKKTTKLLGLVPPQMHKKIRSLLVVLFMRGVESSKRRAFCERLGIAERKCKMLDEFEKRREILESLIQSSNDPFEITQGLNTIPREQLYLSACLTPGKEGKLIRRYLLSWSTYHSPLTGEDLKALGYQPGTTIRQAQQRLTRAVFTNQSLSREEAIDMLEDFRGGQTSVMLQKSQK
jgi:tRNA nucleotidyltransferase (CCA-adding enzyme)